MAELRFLELDEDGSGELSVEERRRCYCFFRLGGSSKNTSHGAVFFFWGPKKPFGFFVGGCGRLVFFGRCHPCEELLDAPEEAQDQLKEIAGSGDLMSLGSTICAQTDRFLTRQSGSRF